ncbi:pentapeptide repeat-containing protein [Antarctobacter heliothermus]|uniref:Pentapeptide repeat-containing protein n=1 Tax=Antarctobacter heliothermus TaxID=74033 RepID=A0A239B910_9RHOB|nr:pentapeptide repeat-containing protein [Antarctobacter heliothermus]SNS04082.1 Pentapeptide repeat-containing protein [Antarctobacter heliothermus]
MDSENVTSLGENLMQAVAFFSMPLVQTVAIAVLAAALAAFLFIGFREKSRTERNEEPATLTGLRVLAVLLAPIWLLIVGYILRSLGALAMDFDATLYNTKDGTELRWHVLGFVGLITALGALVSAPLALIRVWTTERQTRTSEQGHMTDRISKAVEQLGAEKTEVRYTLDKDNTPVQAQRTVPNIEVRIGGLLSLERIAQDSTRYDKGRDHVRVMEILCAYVRENAPAQDAVDFPLMEWEPLAEDASEEERKKHLAWRNARLDVGLMRNPNASQWAQSLDGPRADIALALRIIGRRDVDQLRVEARWLPEALDTAEWVFDTPCPKLPDPPEDQPHPKGAIEAYEARLEGWKAKISGYRGYRPDLRNTNLQKADLSKLTLSGANLTGARMEGAVLTQARMEGAVLWGARMEGAVLTQARMDATTDLTATDVSSVAVRSVDYTNVPLSQAQINGMFGDASVDLPEDRERPEHWPTWELPIDGEHNFHGEWKKWQDDPEGYEPPDPP